MGFLQDSLVLDLVATESRRRGVASSFCREMTVFGSDTRIRGPRSEYAMPTARYPVVYSREVLQDLPAPRAPGSYRLMYRLYGSFDVRGALIQMS